MSPASPGRLAAGRQHAERVLLGLALAASTWLACGEAAGPPPGASPSLRAALVLEPAVIGVGDVGVVELAVVTPPDHVVRPFEPPAQSDGLWLLDSERLDVEKRESRWVHRTRLRLHAREVGKRTWPAGQVEVEAPDGSIAAVPFDALPIEVVSVLPEFPDRLAPFGVRVPPPPSAAPGSLGWAAAGAATALAAVGLAARVRRQRRSRAGVAARSAPAEPPWVAARAELERAGRDLSADPLGAADAVARTLRRYVARRFAADTEARTTEELARATPPFAVTSRWPRFVALLEALDTERFPARERVDGERIRALLADARDFVEQSVPDTARPPS